MTGDLESDIRDSQRSTKPWVTLAIVCIGLAAFGILAFPTIQRGPSLRLRACFQNVHGLREDAVVRLAGVDIGRVRVVRVQPTDKACQAAVKFDLRTPYELKIPADSVVSVETAGLLGELYLNVDSSHATGAPIGDGGQLTSKESASFTAATLDRALKAVEVLKELSDEEKRESSQPGNTGPNTKPSHKPEPSVTK